MLKRAARAGVRAVDGCPAVEVAVREAEDRGTGLGAFDFTDGADRTGAGWAAPEAVGGGREIGCLLTVA